MPAVNSTTIINALLGAFQKSGANTYYVSDDAQIHPRKFIVQREGQYTSIWIYIWSLTPGGRPSLPDEFRIQMTSVTSPLTINPTGYTALLGYHGDSEMFAGFDLVKHQEFTTGSPSVQVDINAVRSASQSGWSFHTKSNDEIAVGLRPDFMLDYILSADALHRYGADAKVLPLLVKASNVVEISPEDVQDISPDRKKIVYEVSRLTRAASFRENVLNAYDHQCAVTGSQLDLLDAAHILPVAVVHSSDDVSNGIALAPTIHRAYDSCLIYLDEKRIMHINEEKADELVARHLDRKIDELRSVLGQTIHLPDDQSLWPREDFIIRANQYRRIPGYI